MTKIIDRAANLVAALVGILLLGLGLRWLVDPSGAAAGIGMQLLDGVARSSQIGDLAAFFVVGGSCALLGLIFRSAALLAVPAALVGTAALFRVVAWAAHDAALAIPMIGPELVMCAILVFAARRQPTAAQ